MGVCCRKMANWRYLSPEHLKGFDRYKYKSVDTSPLSNYVVHPFLDNVVLKLCPMWVAPNLLTFSGWCFVVINFAILSFYDWTYYASSGMGKAPIPQWVWLFCAISQFLAYILDGIDGKQARRTKSSTPLGELFDHGLDSWAAILLPLSLFSAVGRDHKWGGNIHGDYLAGVAVLAGFLLTHWEKYITGVLYLPWLYDITQLGCTLGYLVTYIYGVELWHFYVFRDVTCKDALKWVLIGGFLGSIPVSLLNIYVHYKTPSEDPSQPPRRLGLLAAMAPWLPMVLMVAFYSTWVNLSPSNIIEREPRVFLFTMGVLFSNIACRLIISQMSGMPCELFNYLLVPLVLAFAASILQPQYERSILYSYAVVVLSAHIHYGVSVVHELCTHFRIYCFSLQKPNQTELS